jgi:hypothetical protein
LPSGALQQVNALCWRLGQLPERRPRLDAILVTDAFNASTTKFCLFVVILGVLCCLQQATRSARLGQPPNFDLELDAVSIAGFLDLVPGCENYDLSIICGYHLGEFSQPCQKRRPTSSASELDISF